MYSIGEFSAMSGISKKTLRYYDEIGLLNPSSINPENNYRLYESFQIKRGRDILFYKRLGLSLEQIKEILMKDEKEEVDKVLYLRLKEIECQMANLKNQKTEIGRILEAEQEVVTKEKPRFTITRGKIEKGNTIVVRGEMEKDNPHTLINKLYDLIAKYELELQSEHMVRYCVEESDEADYFEVFAYIDEKHNNEITIEIKESECLITKCQDIRGKDYAYENILIYAKSHQIKIKAFVESYQMKDGKMSVDIMGVID